MVERSLYPLLPVVGPRHGKAVGAIMAGARSGEWQAGATTGRSRSAASSLQPDEFELTARARARATRWRRTATCSSRSTRRSTTSSRPRAWRARSRIGSRRCAGAPGYEISDRVRVAIGGDADGGRARSIRIASGSRTSCSPTELDLGPEPRLPDADAARSSSSTASTLDLSVARA